ncbi:MAG: 50S ribosomal protein L24 [bacterium]|nr:50S ribosomal protein L24 [bacterium]
MKFKAGDQVQVTAGKDKGKKATIIKVLPRQERVIVEGVNMYVKHRKPIGDRPGEKLTLPRPLHTASVAIINNDGKPDRIGYKVLKDGNKVRVFRKTGAEVPEPKK